MSAPNLAPTQRVCDGTLMDLSIAELDWDVDANLSGPSASPSERTLLRELDIDGKLDDYLASAFEDDDGVTQIIAPGRLRFLLDASRASAEPVFQADTTEPPPVVVRPALA